MSSTFTQRIPPGRIVLTYEDYCRLPNDRNRYEVLDGELSVTPAPRISHQRVSNRLHRFLDNHVVANQLGEILTAPTDLILAPTTVVQPDLVFISNDRRHIVAERAIEGPPNLVIEILSPTTGNIDRVTKAQLYARYIDQLSFQSPLASPTATPTMRRTFPRSLINALSILSDCPRLHAVPLH